jgi:hypothetical protein
MVSSLLISIHHFHVVYTSYGLRNNFGTIRVCVLPQQKA